jgi:Na+-transporting NADH:ubiquinone oxidoreductase subunit C
LQSKTSYIIGFASAVCLVCGIIVAGAAVGLKDRQDANAVLDRQKKVLVVTGLMKEGEKISPAEVQKRFEENIKTRVVDMTTGKYAADDAVDLSTYDPEKASKDPSASKDAPDNKAKVASVPNLHLIYEVQEGGQTTMLVLPVKGKGLWSTLYGYLALDKDGQTVKGLTFYQHGETPGLGGEVDNPKWKGLWAGRKVYEGDEVKLMVTKGQAGPVAEDPYRVDGLSGATITSNGVTFLIQFWLGKDAFGPFIKNFTKGQA